MYLLLIKVEFVEDEIGSENIKINGWHAFVK